MPPLSRSALVRRPVELEPILESRPMMETPRPQVEHQETPQDRNRRRVAARVLRIRDLDATEVESIRQQHVPRPKMYPGWQRAYVVALYTAIQAVAVSLTTLITRMRVRRPS